MNNKVNATASPPAKAAISALAINRLLQLCSANLPVGGFSFSQGLEYAVELGWINNPDTCYQWVNTLLTESISRTDLAVIPRLNEALKQNDIDAFTNWNQFLIATRESKELKLADLAMGKALVRLLNNLDSSDLNSSDLNSSDMDSTERDTKFKTCLAIKDMSFVSAFTLAAYSWQIDSTNAQAGFCWTVIDNQVAAATKLVPLGQTQSQNLLFKLSQQVENWLNLANTLTDAELGGSLPSMAMASAWHETQYTRLFRS